MEYLSIKNWKEFQHYKDRNPPWIKLYHSLLDDYEYSCLQDASKLLLMSLYMLASRTANKIPFDPEWIKQKAMLKTSPDVQPLLDAGFIKLNGDASNMLAERKQDDSPRALAREETETEKSREEGSSEAAASPFQTFWKAYPHKVDKKRALKAWEKLKPNQKLTKTILAAIEKQKQVKERKKSMGEFVAEWPHPTTWLNGERWEDEDISPKDSGLCEKCGKEPKYMGGLCIDCHYRRDED